MTLRSRLILLVLVALLPAILVIIDTTVDQYRYLRGKAQEQVLEVARLTVRFQEPLITETQQLFKLLEEIPEINEARPIKCNALLKEVLFGNLKYANLGVIRPNGELACSAVEVASPLNLSDRGYFRNALQTRRMTIGTYQLGRIVKKPVQNIGYPILDEQGNVKLVLFAALNLDWLKQLLPTSGMPPGSAIVMVDGSGVILAREPDEHRQWTGMHLSKDVSVAQHFLVSKHDEWLSEGSGVDGVKRIYALAAMGRSKDMRGFVMVGIPSDYVQASVNEDLIPRIVFFGIFFAVLVGLAWFAGEKLILSRTRALTGATRHLRNGDFAARVVIQGNDELSNLGAEFNHLALTLQQNQRQIHRLNRIHEVLSSINGAILRIRDRDTLLHEACRIAVERGELQFAWIGLMDAKSGEMHKLAWHGNGAAYMETVPGSDDNSGASVSYPCSLAIRDGQAEVRNDIGGVASAPWREHALAHGFRAMAAFPLRREGRVIGLLSLYTDEVDFFAPEETDLFMELAADISLGLEYIDKDQRLVHMLFHDALTGLPNRRLCQDRLQQEIARAGHHNRYVSVIVLNITEFRRVVGLYGNYVADEALNVMASLLMGHVREGDTVARLEGDEFAIVFSDMAGMQDAIHLAYALIADMPSVINCAGQDVNLLIRAGVAIYPGDGNDAAALLSNATLACSVDKSARTHSINFYSYDIQQTAYEREELERALRRALDVGNELELHYQPIVDINTYRIVSLEALARWYNPDLGQVSPARFIPIAEACGLIIPFGDWALKSANRQLAIWRQRGIEGIRVAVNVSFHQLRKEGFIDRLDQILASGPEPLQPQLAIELTESELMNSTEFTIHQLEALRQRNLTIYIDDFGTGYSSLSYLQQLPVQVLKIDQSFVRKLDNSEGGTAIVRTIVALAKSLKMKTIAEGVETRDQLALLQDLGCDYAQGYLFSKPKPEDEITRLLEIGGSLLP